MPPAEIQYSDKYFDEKYEYRHVILPPDLAKVVPRTHLLTETEWRNLGVQQSPGWIHYCFHAPEPHILLFRRPLQPNNNNNTNDTGSVATSMMTATVGLVGLINYNN